MGVTAPAAVICSNFCRLLGSLKRAQCFTHLLSQTLRYSKSFLNSEYHCYQSTQLQLWEGLVADCFSSFWHFLFSTFLCQHSLFLVLANPNSNFLLYHILCMEILGQFVTDQAFTQHYACSLILSLSSGKLPRILMVLKCLCKNKNLLFQQLFRVLVQQMVFQVICTMGCFNWRITVIQHYKER